LLYPFIGIAKQKASPPDTISFHAGRDDKTIQFAHHQQNSLGNFVMLGNAFHAKQYNFVSLKAGPANRMSALGRAVEGS